MPDKYGIRYLPIAVDDLLSISDWIAAFYGFFKASS